MKTSLVAALVLSPWLVAAADPAPPVPDFKFELPPLRLSEALRQTPLTLSNANPIPAPPVPVALLAPQPPGRAMVLVPKNVDPNMPIKKPDAAIDPKIFVPAPSARSGK